MKHFTSMLMGMGIAALTMGCNGVTGASDVDFKEGSGDAVEVPANQGLSCSYPETNYGTQEGTTVAKISWQAIRPGNDTIGELNTAEFMDCDGYKGKNALIFLTHRPG